MDHADWLADRFEENRSHLHAVAFDGDVISGIEMVADPGRIAGLDLVITR